MVELAKTADGPVHRCAVCGERSYELWINPDVGFVCDRHKEGKEES